MILAFPGHDFEICLPSIINGLHKTKSTKSKIICFTVYSGNYVSTVEKLTTKWEAWCIEMTLSEKMKATSNNIYTSFDGTIFINQLNLDIFSKSNASLIHMPNCVHHRELQINLDTMTITAKTWQSLLQRMKDSSFWLATQNHIFSISILLPSNWNPGSLYGYQWL